MVVRMVVVRVMMMMVVWMFVGLSAVPAGDVSDALLTRILFRSFQPPLNSLIHVVFPGSPDCCTRNVPQAILYVVPLSSHPYGMNHLRLAHTTYILLGGRVCPCKTPSFIFTRDTLTPTINQGSW